MHKKNCRQFADYLELVGSLLEEINNSEPEKYPASRMLFEKLEDALRKSYSLIKDCRDRSYLYLLAMGWNIVYQFRNAQDEIDRCLGLVPLITVVGIARVRARVEAIEKDPQREYTLDEEDRRIQEVILNPDTSKNVTTSVLEKTLSFSYPDLPYNEALQKENEMLRAELLESHANQDGQFKLIEVLIEVTESFAGNSCREKNIHERSDATSEGGHLSDENSQTKNDYRVTSRKTSSVTSRSDLLSHRGLGHHEDWHADLLGCCSEPYLCVKTIFCPCGTIARIATVATNRHTSSADTCNELMAYALPLSCCCYTCCIRRKLRKTMNIEGGFIDDFLSHFMCCCCALVQELREVEIRGVYASEKTKTSPPISQYMES